MQKYKLTNQADVDFSSVFEFGIERFGLAQAEKYISEMICRFEQIAENPLQYPKVDEIQMGYRRSTFESHAIYYRLVDEQTVLIVRIIGSQQIA